MAELTVVEQSHSTAYNFTYESAAVAGDEFVNNGRTILLFSNSNATTRTVTIAVSKLILGNLSIESVTFTIAQSETRVIGPFVPAYFNDADGLVQLTYSGVTGLGVRALSLP